MNYETSEYTLPGHPDKVADQLSDAVLDFALAQNEDAHVAVEALVKDNKIVFAGEVSGASVFPHDLYYISENVLDHIGYRGAFGAQFYPQNIEIISLLSGQSEHIGQSVHSGEATAAGDQGTVYGFYTTASHDGLPLSLSLARLVATTAFATFREDTRNLRPDGKTQVTVYRDADGLRKVSRVSLSMWMNSYCPEDNRRTGETMIRAAIGSWMTPETEISVNPPDGLFVQGGPDADCGLTGRKIIVDTYGGHAPHGGGAFSGKDPSKVDRSGAYVARKAAKWLVNNNFGEEVVVGLTYEMGVHEPVRISVKSDCIDVEYDYDRMIKTLRENVDLSVAGSIRSMGMKKPSGWSYEYLARFGHFGYEYLPWEK